VTHHATALDEVRDLVGGPLRRALDRLDPDTRHLCGYHLGFWDADANPTDGAGKGLRPALALLSARATGAGDEFGVPAAIACELVHNFSLLHDDLMDGDVERRHRETVWHRFGAAAAILAGDAMLALANEILAEVASATTPWAVRCLNATTRRLIAGQTLDLAFERRTDVTLAECLKMAGDKTGALLACSASLGAVLADAPSELALGLADYGAHLGAAFQLTDDLLGIWGSSERTGKPELSDLRARKKSAPVVAALESGTADAAELRSLYFGDQDLNEEQLRHVAELIERCGALVWTERKADSEVDAALGALAELDLPSRVATELTTLATGLAGRDH